MVITKHLDSICTVDFGRTWLSHMKSKKVHWSLNQHLPVKTAWSFISLWAKSHLLMVFLLRTSCCFDIGIHLRKLISGQDGCVESPSPDHIPHGCWVSWPLLLWSPLYSFPSPQVAPLFSLPETIPPGAAGNSPVCWKVSLTSTQHPFHTDMRFGPDRIQQPSQSFRNCKITSDWFRKEILWQGKWLGFDNFPC